MAQQYSDEDLGRIMREYVLGKFAEGRSKGWVIDDLVRQGIAQDMAEMIARVLSEEWTNMGRTPPDTMPDYYELLQVSPNADIEVIQAAYRRLASKHHPDRNPGDPTANQKTKLLNEAFSVLGDPNARELYDRQRQQAADRNGPTSAGQADEAKQSPTLVDGIRGTLSALPPIKPKTIFIIIGVLAGAFLAHQIHRKTDHTWSYYLFSIVGATVGAIAAVVLGKRESPLGQSNQQQNHPQSELVVHWAIYASVYLATLVVVLCTAGSSSDKEQSPNVKVTADTDRLRKECDLAFEEGGEYGKRREYAKAIDRYEHAAKIAEQLRESRVQSNAVSLRGVMRMEQRDWRGAETDLSEAIRIDPNNDIPYAARADCISKATFNCDIDAVIKDASTAIRLNSLLKFSDRYAVY